MIQSMTHVCKRCGVEFMLEAPHYKRTWCRPCKLEYSKVHNANYTPPVKEALCLVCGIVFSGRKRNQKYCSDACRYYCPGCEPDRVAGIKRTCTNCRVPQDKCLSCGSSFDPKSHNKKYCSYKCGDAARYLLEKQKRPQSLTCKWCHEEFPYRLGKDCCTKKCSNAFVLHMKQYRSPDRCHLPICRECGTVHGAPIQAFISRRFRCSQCAKPHKDRATAERDRRKGARRRSVISSGEKIDVLVVADRDCWVCHLCNEPIDQSLQWPHPGALTLDHVIPLAPYSPENEPGTHTWDNVRAAHSLCNSRRCNRPIAC